MKNIPRGNTKGPILHVHVSDSLYSILVASQIHRIFLWLRHSLKAQFLCGLSALIPSKYLYRCTYTCFVKKKKKHGILTFHNIGPLQAFPRRKRRREKDIEELVRNRRQLRKRWRKATTEEKEGLKLTWDDLKQRLAKPRQTERIRRRRKQKEKTRSSMPTSCWMKSEAGSWSSPKMTWNNTSRASTRMQPKIHHLVHLAMCHVQTPRGPHLTPLHPG